MAKYTSVLMGSPTWKPSIWQKITALEIQKTVDLTVQLSNWNCMYSGCDSCNYKQLSAHLIQCAWFLFWSVFFFWACTKKVERCFIATFCITVLLFCLTHPFQHSFVFTLNTFLCTTMVCHPTTTVIKYALSHSIGINVANVGLKCCVFSSSNQNT